MSWYWWVLIVVLAFGLGIASAQYFRGTHPPDRRASDRRHGDRRSAQGQSTSDLLDRRARRRDRRGGRERRRGKPAWQLATVVLSAVFLSAVGVVAYAESQVASIFADSQPELINSGWADCDTPITWSTDTSRLSASDARVATTQIRRDLDKWASVSGLDFRYVGEVPVIYDDSAFVVTSDEHPSARHLYMAFLHDSESSLLDERTVGFASPTKVFKDKKEITEGSVVLSIDYVRKISAAHRNALYLHEIGHALGLAHGTAASDVMYYLVDTNNTLSAADIQGIRSLIKACESAQGE